MANFLQSFLQNLTKKRPTKPNSFKFPHSGPTSPVKPPAPKPPETIPTVLIPRRGPTSSLKPNKYNETPGVARRRRGLTAAAAVGAGGLAYNGSGGQGAEWSGPSTRPVAGKPQQATPRKGGPGRSPTGPRPKASPAPKPRPAQTTQAAPAARSQVTASAPQSPKVTVQRTQMDDEYGSYYTGQAQRNKKFGRIDR